jgi:purine-cytosine permease-like protein
MPDSLSHAVSAHPGPRVDHERLYTLLLSVLIAGTGAGIYLATLVLSLPPGARAPGPTRPPDFFVWLELCVSLFYMPLMLLALAARLTNHRTAHMLTRFLNYALLPALPFGTLLGAFGLTALNSVDARGAAQNI